MDISKYTSFFHDGAIMDIRHVDDSIDLAMYSAEMDEDDLQDDIVLSKDNSIQGWLHIEGIKNITINENPFSGVLKKTHDHVGIFHFELTNVFVEFDLIWENYRPKSEMYDFSSIKIEAEKIWWETIPDLEDLYP
jgi:hypothetical protein